MIQIVGKNLSQRGLRCWRRTIATLGTVLPVLMLMGLPTAHAQSGAWPMFGQNASNTASNNTATLKNAARLATKWTFTTGGEVSARPSVVDNVVYVPEGCSGAYDVVLHFHGAHPYVRDLAVKAQIHAVIAVFNSGNGAERYGQAFQVPGALSSIMRQVAAAAAPLASTRRRRR